MRMDDTGYDFEKTYSILLRLKNKMLLRNLYGF